MPGKQRSWTDEQLMTAVLSSGSVSQVLEKLGLGKTGGNYENIGFHIERLGLDKSHFHGQGWNKGLKFKPNHAMDNEEWFQKGVQRNRKGTKSRLKRAGVPQVCKLCGLDSWLGNPITLQLDHEDGDRYNNELGNLRLLCPNCHSQTETFSGRNKRP